MKVTVNRIFWCLNYEAVFRELKMYLRLRGLKVTDRKAELVARVFVASETNLTQAVKSEKEYLMAYVQYRTRRRLKDFGDLKQWL